MVTRLVGLSSLNRKLVRDLWAMKAQALAIALVIAAGIAMFVAYLSNFDSLQGTRDRYYQAQRFADAFAAAVRVPDRVRAELQSIEGVTDIEARIVADVVLDVPGLDEPATGRLVSVPAEGRPRLNDLFLRRGSWISADRPDDVIASEAFVLANRFEIGDHVQAVINGRRRQLTIVGVALSPEFIYSIRPGELVPDARRFGVLWMERDALAGAFDMKGGFNNVSFVLARDASPQAVLDAVDRTLGPYGGRGAITREQQFSNWSLQNELGQLQSFGFFVPLLFLFVAAFVLNIAMTRALALQRPQLAALKALGYTNRELAWHYVKWALAIALVGAAVGVAAGTWMGQAMLTLYNEYFKFPILEFRLTPNVAMGAVAIALCAAAAGAATAVGRAVRISPAEAMRPEAPARYRKSALDRSWLGTRLSNITRMVARNIQRQPIRAATTVVGIGFACAILCVGFSLLESMEMLIATEFSSAERQDTTVDFVLPVSASGLHALERLPGVRVVEPSRVVPIRIRSGYRQRSLTIMGLPATLDLRRPIDRDGHVVVPPPDGIMISAILAQVLGVTRGDDVSVQILEGRQETHRLRVEALVDDTFGISAYMSLEALHRLLGEGATLSGASLLVDAAQERALTTSLKQVPAVAGIASKKTVLANFRKTMDQNMGLIFTFNIGFAGIIAFGVVYNAARVSLSERSRELASLRVLGFTRAEISAVLLGELAILTSAALPVGMALGYGLTALLVHSVESEIYRFPLVVSTRVMAFAALVVLAASTVSALVVRRRLDRLDLVAVLKLRE